MLTLVAAVEVYERASDGREMLDCVSVVLVLLAPFRAADCDVESRKVISCTRDENDIVEEEMLMRGGCRAQWLCKKRAQDMKSSGVSRVGIQCGLCWKVSPVSSRNGDNTKSSCS